VSPIITLLTDYGTGDTYVAEVKGALLSRVPEATLVDVTHEVPPGDVATAAWLLARAASRFPDGTVHLAVVDPGVGTKRRALAAQAGPQCFVAPDNGLLTWVLDKRPRRVVAVPIPPEASPTFHGRDVFAPAAAELALGRSLDAVGSPVDDPVLLPRPSLTRAGGDQVGQVVHVDRFGTLVTNIPAARVAVGAAVRVGVYDLVLRSTFADVPPGDPVAFVGSGGTVEIAVRDGRADTVLGVTRGAEVRATAR
jgi:S-adenosylmethionine hydrolase